MNIAPVCRPGARSAPIMPVQYGCAKRSAIFDDLFIAPRQSDGGGRKHRGHDKQKARHDAGLSERHRQEDERQTRGGSLAATAHFNFSARPCRKSKRCSP
ncbi:hypothetical protein [Paraburkholderia kururiensis]|uniref:hypothetical protein n=1 Tax=Paraburkholderia kururiensis TaxID=984307 RepID=UPI0012E0A798|nr:hypothetical protein [Paraburkholderia kururiensis]